MISDESSKESRGEAVVYSEEELEERQQKAHGGNTSSRVMKNSWCHQCKMRKEVSSSVLFVVRFFFRAT